MNKTTSKPRKRTNLLWVILVVHCALALIYWHFTPYGMPPDEGPHGLYVQSLVEQHKLPVFDPADRGNYEAHQPPLYYVLGAPFYMLGDAMGLDNPAEAVRLLSLILGALSILVVYQAVSAATVSESSLALAAAGFVALLPTHVMLSSSVSNDILSELIFGLGLLVSTNILVRGVSMPRTLAAGAIIGLGLLTKTTCLLIAPIILAAFLFIALRARPVHKLAFLHFIIAALTALVIGGWWLVRNYALYGDPFAASQFALAFGHTAKPEYWLSRGFSIGQYWLLVIAWTFCSFFGVFGHMKVFMPTWFYLALAVLTLVVKAGVVRLRAGFVEGSTEVRRDVLALYTMLVVLVAASFVVFNTQYFQAQGRYLYPAILPFAVYWALGIRKAFPKSMEQWTSLIVMAVPLAAQIMALLTMGTEFR